jgi:fluoride exporter
MLLYVALGSALGGMARYALGGWMQRISTGFPWGTLTINLIGSFVLGCFMRYALAGPTRSDMRGFVAIGLCGGFTTFSTFSYESVMLLRDGQWLRAVGYAGASVFLGIGATIAGLATARHWV